MHWLIYIPVGILVFAVGAGLLGKFVLFRAPNIPVMNSGATVAIGGQEATLEADDTAVADVAESVHKCRFEIRYSDGTKDKPKKGKWKQHVMLRAVPGPAKVYAYNCCPITDYASGKSEALEITIQ